MAKGESWDGCRFLYVCCDYGVCHAWHLTSKNSQPGERHG